MPKIKLIGNKTRKALHPYARKAAQLNKEVHRIERVNRGKAERANRVLASAKKLLWFQQHLDSNLQIYDTMQICQLIELYLHRFDEEIQEIEGFKQLGRNVDSKVAREGNIKLILDQEWRQYLHSGFEAPDLTTAEKLTKFRDWDGGLKTLRTIETRKYQEKGMVGFVSVT